MKPLLPILGLFALGAGLLAEGPQQEVTVIISGGARGHLSPCGCTKPMSGGMLRLATIVRREKAKGNVVWVDTGDIIETPGRQSQMKAETYSELMGDLGVDAVAYTSLDRQQGVGLLMASTSLSKTQWLSPEELSDKTISEKKVSGLTVSAFNQTSATIGTERESDIMLLDGPKGLLSQSKMQHQLAVFASDGIPTVDGNQVSPGSNFRGIVIAKFRDAKFVSARVEILESHVKEDPGAAKVYRNYLQRVTQERLIDQVPKDSDEDFAGSKNCKSCHTATYNKYLKTGHSHAYQTLQKVEHQADPDCVSCHVVGLNSKKGFWFQKTPSLGQVGCESCHGGGRAHARSPKLVKLPKVQPEKCLPCHTPSNSPGFNFKSFWAKIKH